MIKSLLGVLLLLPAAAADETFTVGGTVNFKGVVPPPKPDKRMEGDPKCCALHEKLPPKEELVVDAAGGTRWAFVYIKKGLEGKTFAPPAEPVVLDQVGCRYSPHVFGIMVGQPLEIRNSDPVMHNINATAMVNKGFNFAQPVKGQVDRVTFAQREVMLPIACNVHPWMKVSAGVLDHPFYAVTDAAGKFEIRNLPAGKYTLGAWHEKLKFDDQEIDVKANLTVSFIGALK